MSLRRVGRYLLHEPIATGGMASVHLGRIIGPAGFSRTVAIKRLHPHLARDPEFVSMFLDEARLAARIQHPNVVSTLDVLASEGELFLVMDYVLGESLSQLVRAATAKGEAIPPRIASSVVAGVLNGLHGAHEARMPSGESMGIVHRDVSPQNILVGVDGVARVVDFGVAKAVSRMQSTQDGQIKGKLSYMSPEQIMRDKVDRRTDLYAVGVVLWEMLALRRLFAEDNPGQTIAAVLEGNVPPLPSIRDDVTPALDAVVQRAVANDRRARFATAVEFVEALEAAAAPAPAREVTAWVTRVAGVKIDERRKLMKTVELTTSDEPPPADDAAVDELISGPRTPEQARRIAEAATQQLAIDKHAEQLPSEVVSVSTALEETSRPPVWGRRVAWVAATLAAMGVAVGATYFWVRGREHVSITGSAGGNVVAAPAASGSVVAFAPLVPLPSASSSADTAAAQPVATAAKPVKPGRTPRATTTAAAAAPGPAPSGKPDCNPKFTLDADGVKRFKPWCL